MASRGGDPPAAWLLIPILILALGPAAAALQEPPPPAPVADTQLPDLEIHALVHIDELTVHEVSEPRVTFPGTGERRTVFETERRNLPEDVEQGATYHDVTLRLIISSTFDLEELLALLGGEAGGERPPLAPPAEAPPGDSPAPAAEADEEGAPR